MRGACEVDLNIETKEIRENLTDFDHVGNEQIGNENVLSTTVLLRASFARTTRPQHVFLKVVGFQHFTIRTKLNV